jgi:hypothetical protein
VNTDITDIDLHVFDPTETMPGMECEGGFPVTFIDVDMSTALVPDIHPTQTSTGTCKVAVDSFLLIAGIQTTADYCWQPSYPLKRKPRIRLTASQRIRRTGPSTAAFWDTTKL